MNLKKYKNINKYLISCILIISFVIIPLFSVNAPKARAHGPVIDVTNIVQTTLSAISNALTAFGVEKLVFKEYILDPLAWLVSTASISEFTAGIIDWINTGGPDGGPTFVTDLGQFLKDIVDSEIADFFAEGEGSPLEFLCEPWGDDIKRALSVNVNKPFGGDGGRAGCTLDKIIGNIEDASDFLDGDFSKGGWDGWFELTVNNNPYRDYLESAAELEMRIAAEQYKETTLLDFGSGFFSSKDGSGSITTPGTIIKQQLERTINSSLERLEVADELIEVIESLLVDLVFQLGSSLGGLRGASDGGANSLTSRLRDSAIDSLIMEETGIGAIIATIQEEESYQAIKQTAFDATQVSKRLLARLRECYDDKVADAEAGLIELTPKEKRTAEIKAEDASFTYENSVQPKENQLDADIKKIDLNVKALNDIINKINNSNTTGAQFSGYLAEFVKLKGTLHSSEARPIYDAEEERKSIVGEMRLIDIATNEEIIKCRDFPEDDDNSTDEGGLTGGEDPTEDTMVFSNNPIYDILFVPDRYVPLSEFVKRDADTGNSLILDVNIDILKYIGDDISIARNTVEGIELIPPTTKNNISGKVTFDSPPLGVFTVVSGAFINDFPIVTHWDKLSGSKGGPKQGAYDQVGPLIDTDFTLVIDTDSTLAVPPRPVSDNSNSPCKPFSGTGIYYYNTDICALFSGDPVNPNAKVPGYERYVGEDYAISKISNTTAIWMSNEILKNSGYPVVHLNQPDPQEDAPVFQVLHSQLIAKQSDKGSLATIILPPHWVSNPTKRYPILFNGFYDINENFANVNAGIGLRFMKIIDQLLNEGSGSIIGILWNGGGATASITMQRSAYDNVSLLFSRAKTEWGADSDAIVVTGVSRGGVTALIVASNPYYNNYKVKYAIASAPGEKFGAHVTDFANPTYPAIFSVLTYTTGYKYAWQPGWTETGTGLPARELFLKNLIEEITDKYVADSQYSAISDEYIKVLKANGTKVVLAVGTHDVFIPFSPHIEYVEKLRSKGIPVRFEINYRSGHDARSRGGDELLKEVMRKVISGSNDTSFEKGTVYYKRSGSLGMAKFNPTSGNLPIFLEAPKEMIWGENISMTVVGGSGTQFEIKIWKIDDDKWNSQIVEKGKQFGNTISGTLLALPYSEITSYDYIETVPSTMLAGYYLYELRYSVDGGNTWANADKIPQSGAQQPVLLVREDISGISNMDGSQRSSQLSGSSNQAWGLSSE